MGEHALKSEFFSLMTEPCQLKLFYRLVHVPWHYTPTAITGNMRTMVYVKLALITIILFASMNNHYGDVIMVTIAYHITSLTIVYSTFYSGADQRKHQSSASLAFVRGIHRGLVNSPHKWPVTRKMFPFDDAIMTIMQSNGMRFSIELWWLDEFDITVQRIKW